MTQCGICKVDVEDKDWLKHEQSQEHQWRVEQLETLFQFQEKPRVHKDFDRKERKNQVVLITLKQKLDVFANEIKFRVDEKAEDEDFEEPITLQMFEDFLRELIDTCRTVGQSELAETISEFYHTLEGRLLQVGGSKDHAKEDC